MTPLTPRVWEPEGSDQMPVWTRLVDPPDRGIRCLVDDLTSCGSCTHPAGVRFNA